MTETTKPTAIKPKYPVVWIIWDDAESDSSWSEEPTTPLGPTHATTMGFLVRDEKDYVLVADSYFPNSKIISNTTKIPRGMIVEMIELTINKKKKKIDKTKEAAESVGKPPSKAPEESQAG